jgi:hypothetical protein
MPTEPSGPQRPAAPLPVIPTPILVSLATGPFLCGLVVGKALTQAMLDISRSSEEIFRGDRLPILPFAQPLEDEAIEG